MRYFLIYKDSSLKTSGLDGLVTDKAANNSGSATVGRESRLALLLQLGTSHTGDHEYSINDRTYLEGWRHCLMAIKGI